MVSYSNTCIMFTKFTLSQFLDSNVHIGHSKNLRDKKYNLYLVFTRDGVDIINTLSNLPLLRKVVFVMTNLSYRRKKILFVSENAAVLSFFSNKSNHPFVSIRWSPGMLSNFKMTARTIRKISLKKFGRGPHYSNFLRVKKAINYFSGVMQLYRVPDFAFFCTAQASPIAILEAKTYRIPTSGIIDSNGSPYIVSYPIFGNDDSFYSLTFILDSIFQSLEYGNSHRVLYFLQRALVSMRTLFVSDVFLSKFERLLCGSLKALNKGPVKRLSLEGQVKSVSTFLKFFLFLLQSQVLKRKGSFKEFIRVVRYFVKLQQTRVFIVSNLLQKTFMSDRDLFLFFYFILFKIDSNTRSFLSKIKS